jgi:hypothetical protein
MTPGNLPKILFYQIEQCQEIQRIGKIPYSDDQIIVTVVLILVESNIFPVKKFGTWEAMATKTYQDSRRSSMMHMDGALPGLSSATCRGRTVTASNRISTLF